LHGLAHAVEHGGLRLRGSATIERRLRVIFDAELYPPSGVMASKTSAAICMKWLLWLLRDERVGPTQPRF